jgi:hypothetical protein
MDATGLAMPRGKQTSLSDFLCFGQLNVVEQGNIIPWFFRQQFLTIGVFRYIRTLKDKILSIAHKCICINKQKYFVQKFRK